MAKYLLNMWYCAQYILAMYIESVPNRNSPPAILLRESFRDGAKIKKHTIANLSDWPAELGGEIESALAVFRLERVKPHNRGNAIGTCSMAPEPGQPP